MLSQFLCEGGLGPVGAGAAAGLSPQVSSSCDRAALPASSRELPLPVASAKGVPASPPPHSLPPCPFSVPQAWGTLLWELPHQHWSKWGRCPERLSGQPLSQSTGFGPALPRGEQLSLSGPLTPPCQAAPGAGCGLAGKAGGAADSCHPPPAPSLWLGCRA